jgi:hypothetical protein
MINQNIQNNANSSSPLGARGRSRGAFWVLVKSAFRSLIGNGLKTWLIVSVLSFTFFLIIFMQALLDGWSKQAVTDAEKWEVA